MHCFLRCGWVAALLGAVLIAGCGGSRAATKESAFRYASSGLVRVPSLAGGAAKAPASKAPASKAPARAVDRALPRGTSTVATSRSRPITVYRSLRDARPEQRFPVRDHWGITQVFLVKRELPGWLEVYLPTRPNDSTGWVRSSSVRLTLDPYRLVVDTARHQLTTLRAGRVVMHTTVGIGKSATPTPHGLFYIVEALKMVPATGPYGTYAFGLSAHSTVLKTFGTGDAQVALHGTNEPASIGQNWSNGCVHMSDSVANWMARTVPLGTPVQIS